jgi:hypothetical protein
MDLKEYADMKLLTDREKLSFWKGFTVGILFLILSVEVCFTVMGIFGAVV